MKKYITLVSIFIASFYSCSEESLTLNSPNDVTVADLLTTVEGFEQLLVGAYDAYQKIPANEYLITEVRTDNAKTGAEFGSLLQFTSYSLDGSSVEVFNYWSNNYKVVFQANLLIDNESFYSSLPNSDNAILGEAYFLRALAHFNLVRAFRDVPYITSVVDAGSFTDFPQLEEAVTYEMINADFERAITLLADAEISQTRAHRGIATIMLAKSILSQPNPDYIRAQSLLLPLIEDGNEFGYTLTSNYADIFAQGAEGDEGNEEIIFQIKYSASSGTPVTSSSEVDDQIESDAERWSFDMSSNGTSNGSNIATDDLKSAFITVEANGDITILEPVRYPATLDVEAILETRTFNTKFVPDNSLVSGNDWIVSRYADVLLLYCEAVIGDTPSTDNMLAIDAFNKVRTRAGVATLAAGESLTRGDLLHERRVEFVYENQRLYDLIRFGEAITTLQEFSDVEELFFDPTDIYVPIPQREIDNSDGFFQ